MSKMLMLVANLAFMAAVALVPGPSFAGISVGACCHKFLGCCPPSGDCQPSTPVACSGPNEQYQGDGTDCFAICFPTTTTTLPVGACCEPGGACLDVIEANCVVGDYQGDGTECETVECPQPTTTTAPDTTTTTEYLPPTTTVDNTTTTTTPDAALCGDANDDGEVSSVDALITLRTSVGVSSCPETRCDYNGNGNVQSSDALAILRVSVGQTVAPNCPLL